MDVCETVVLHEEVIWGPRCEYNYCRAICVCVSDWKDMLNKEIAVDYSIIPQHFSLEPPSPPCFLWGAAEGAAPGQRWGRNPDCWSHLPPESGHTPPPPREMKEIVQGEIKWKERRWVERAGKTFNNRLFVTSCANSLSFFKIVFTLFSIFLPLAQLFPASPLPSVLSRVPPTASSSNLSLEATSNRISLTNTLGWTTHTWARPTVMTHNGIWQLLCKHHLFWPTWNDC